MKAAQFVGCIAGCALAVSQASANLIFDTGVDSSGNSLSPNSIDTHYLLDGGNAVVVTGNSFPIPPWLDYSAGNGNSRWISVDSAGGSGSLPGMDHSYVTTFSLTSAGYVLSGQWSSDNASDVYLNGNFIASLAFGSPGNYSFQHYASFSTANFLVSGVNTLQFLVHNGDVNQQDGVPGGWFGLRAEGLTLTAIPEPTTVIAGALLLLPFGASVLRKLRKNRTA